MGFDTKLHYSCSFGDALLRKMNEIFAGSVVSKDMQKKFVVIRWVMSPTSLSGKTFDFEYSTVNILRYSKIGGFYITIFVYKQPFRLQITCIIEVYL